MNTVRLSIAVLALGALVLTSLLLGGCAKKLEGNAYENQKPIVWFVNVPPESARSSVNPIVNWYGQDQDGQIDFYRYIVIREEIMGDSLGKPEDWNPSTAGLTETEIEAFVDSYLTSISDTLWTKLLVRADSVDPHTSNIIPMSAEIDNPVLAYVPQFVFVQAFDEQGLGSDVVFRRFLRNDNPPATRIVGFIDGVPFINSPLPTGSSTGIRIRWSGSDVIDYPSDAPPFEFEWKLFGPYTQADYNYIFEHYLQKVFVTNDARMLWFRQPPQIIVDTFWNDDHTAIDSIKSWPFYTSLIVCDTTYEGGSELIECDTMAIDSMENSNVYGTIDTLLRVYDEEFIASPYYVVADSSHDEYGNNWTTELRDSIYDVYWNHPADTTQVSKFIFVVRSRDDAKVPDLTPAYRGFTVINPQHERDILIIDWAIPAGENRALTRPASLSQRTFWTGAVTDWISNTPHGEVLYDPALDYNHIQDFMDDAVARAEEHLLRKVLKYKVAIMVQDAATQGSWNSQGAPVSSILTGLQTGVNVWWTGRVPIGNLFISSGPAAITASSNYQYFFGVQQYSFPGWGSYCRFPGVRRTEDFVGTLSLDRDQWPDLEIDTALLHKKYLWIGSVVSPDTPDVNAGNPWRGWFPDLGALPQVGWVVRTYDTEPMYLFRSLYGNEHGVYRELSYHGRPVGIRLDRGLFRTVHFVFGGPYALSTSSGQQMINGVLSWLYDGRTQLSSLAKGSKEAALADDLGSRYWNCYWQADGDREKLFELLKDAY